jgi:LacI family transcriptional regulator
MEDVARAAGVSTATVSRVLNTPDRVARETAARVQRAIETLGYKPNVFAQGLMTRRSRLLGILLPDIHGEFYSELLRGADAEARRQGYHLLISSEGRGLGEGGQDEGLFGGNVVGFIAGLAVMITEPNESLLAHARGSGLPLVVIDEDMNGERIDRVLVDNASGTREAVEHLLSGRGGASQQGGRGAGEQGGGAGGAGGVLPGDMVFVGGPAENFDTAERARVFVATLAERGHAASASQTLFGEYDVEWGREAGGRLFRALPPRPVGVLAGNDEIALGLLQAAEDAGVEVPARGERSGGVRVVGFDDTRLTTVARPPLSSVRVPTADLGAAAVRTLIERLQHPEREPVTVTLPTRLVVRGTS